MEKWKKRAVELLSNIAITCKENPAVIPYIPAKTKILPDDKKSIKRADAKNFDIPYSKLTSLLCSLNEEARANVHSIMVICDGKVISEASAPGYSVSTPHLSHSMSKTLTGLAIGFLYDEGDIDINSPVASFFPELEYRDSEFPNMTVENLLSMSSGIPFAEIGVATEDKWCEAFFSSELSFKPGTKFSYNSMNSYILGRIVTKISGLSLTDFLKPRLLIPLGIENFFWERNAEGYEKGGFGVYMSCESWAKVGIMMLGEGVFSGKRILSSDWIRKMTAVKSFAPEEIGGFDYGYHVWVSREEDEFLLNGMFGQNVYVSKKNNIVVSLTSGNNELFQTSPALSIIREHLREWVRYSGRERRYKKAELRQAEKTFFIKRRVAPPLPFEKSFLSIFGISRTPSFDERWNGIIGEYAFPKNNSSLLPVFLSVMQSNYLGGIQKLAIKEGAGSVSVTFTEGGKDFSFDAGLYSFKKNIMDFEGEKYILLAAARAMSHDGGKTIFKIEIRFPELPNTKTIELSFDSQRLILHMSECPNERAIEGFFASVTSSAKASFVIGLLERKYGQGFLFKKLAAVLNPTLYGIDMKTSGWQTLISAENELLRVTRENSTRLLSTIISRFILDEKEDEDKESVGDGGFIKKALGALFSKKKAEPKEDSEILSKTGHLQIELSGPEYAEKSMLPESDKEENR